MSIFQTRIHPTQGLLLLFLLSGCFKESKESETSARADSKIPICFGPLVTDIGWYDAEEKAVLLEGLQGIDFKISTSVPEAQAYFNQGMMLSYGFNHGEAARSFFEATRLDSTCAMAWWGFALVLGPNYNGGMDESNIARAWEAVEHAKRLSSAATPLEKALIDALATRYAPSVGTGRPSLDSTYAKAMEAVHKTYPNNPDVGALYAESVMDMHPWDLYEKGSRKPKAWTPTVTALLEDLLRRHPNHAGANHLYIHAMEASAPPEKALPSARLLESLVPGAGHLLHMPSHIYINTGDYHLASRANVRALAVDSAYFTACHAQGVYPLAYFPHNYHFLAATATLEGASALAIQAAQKMQEYSSGEIMRQEGWGTLQHYYTISYYVAVKFSNWDAILNFPAPADDLIYPRAIWRYARGMAFLGKKELGRARQELQSLDSLASDTTLLHLTVWDINTTADLAQIAQKVLAAGVAAQEDRLAEAEVLLREAIAREDALNYNEPPDWFFSVRHHLGAVLLKEEKAKEAEGVYREDLLTWRKNGWALIGLYQSLTLQKKLEEAARVKQEFDLSWQHADVPLSSSSTIAL
jgi:tetratricopeptide (TPR) repeat protein